jgi:fructose-1,6-bisphosphatase II
MDKKNRRSSIDATEAEVAVAMNSAVIAAAINCAHWRGRGKKNLADKAAVKAIEHILNKLLPIGGVVVIGEGVRDNAPMLYIGQQLGPKCRGNKKRIVRIAVDPLEGTNLCADGRTGAICVMAGSVEGEGHIQEGVDGYMDKIVLGKYLTQRLPHLVGINQANVNLLDIPIEEVANWVAKEQSKKITDVNVMILKRDRNQEVIDCLRKIGAQVSLIDDGDVNAGMMALDPNHVIDFTVGIGAAAEGVITAAMARVAGGSMYVNYWFDYDNGEADMVALINMGIDVKRHYREYELASGHVIVAAAYVTDGLAPGVRFIEGGAAIVNSMRGRSRTGTIYRIESEHPNPPQPTEDFFKD